MPSEEVAMEHQFFIRQQNLKLYRSLVAASETAAVSVAAFFDGPLSKDFDGLPTSSSRAL
jgi:hypothetical protein